MTSINRCRECGAEYGDSADSCAARFQRLLALDHSRQEPWGSRHGQAFAAFALQHPVEYARSVDAARDALCRIYCLNEAPSYVFAALRRREVAAASIPRRPNAPLNAPSLTIADLDDFAAATYAAHLDAWCRATLATWGVASAIGIAG